MSAQGLIDQALLDPSYPWSTLRLNCHGPRNGCTDTSGNTVIVHLGLILYPPPPRCCLRYLDLVRQSHRVYRDQLHGASVAQDAGPHGRGRMPGAAGSPRSPVASAAFLTTVRASGY